MIEATMPKILPLTLELNESLTEVYDPSVKTDTGAVFVCAHDDAIYNSSELRVSTRPAAAGNTGRTMEVLGIRPIPIRSENGCCTDVTKPEGNTFRLSTMVRKTSSAAEAELLVEMIRAFVVSEDFEELVLRSSYY